jgi:hypothetical protein
MEEWMRRKYEKGSDVMNANNQVGNLLAILFAGFGLVACTTQAASPSGTGGSGGTGTTGAGGTSTTGAGGSSTTGAGGGAFASSLGTACAAPDPTGVITNFTYNPDGGATDQVPWGTFGTTLSGGESIYANSGATLTSNVTAGDWHLTGNIANYAGFNIYYLTNANPLVPCNKFDASAFKGIQFTIWGSTAGNPIAMGVTTLDDAVAYGWLDSKDAGSPAMPTPGTCVPSSGNGQYYHPGCADPSYAISVTGTQSAPQTVSIPWASFTGGLPTAGVTPTGIISIYWNFGWMPPTTAYDVDIHIDNLAFITQ